MASELDLKNIILQALLETTDYVSGQSICDTYHVSRTAIWKHIRSLKEDGYEIESVNRKGYRLISKPDLVTKEAVTPYLATKKLGREIFFYEETDSTNTRAKLHGETGGAEGSLFIAERQTGGKGRRGRNWDSPSGISIYMSLLLRPNIAPDHASMLTLVTAMAVAKSMSKIEGIEYGIKWPNDIIVNGKKICGILTEMSTEINDINYVVVGIGINVNALSFPDEIKDVATSLKIETGKDQCRAKIVADVMNYFEQYYEAFLETGDLSLLLDEYHSLLINCGKEVRIIERESERIMKAIGIDKEGALIVEGSSGEKEHIISGEVSVRGILGYV